MIDYSAFENALSQLETSLGYLNSELSSKDPGLRKQFRAATIQAFEFTYELAVKMIRRQLSEIVANPADLPQIAFMDLIRTAADAGLVRAPAPFRTYRDKRNITSHTYDEDTAENILSVLDDFLTDMRFLLGELQRRNQ
jgi:nucleotidyltransferase substrate binding protein (TIGR01987 family)